MGWPHPDWRAVEPFPFAEAGRAFTGERRRQFLWMRYFEKPGGSLVALADFGPLSEGPPGLAHGGAVLTALDEALGAAAWHVGRRVLMARLSAEIRRSVPLGAELLIETRLERTRLRAVDLSGAMLDSSGALYAAAQGRFMELTPEAHTKLFGPRP